MPVDHSAAQRPLDERPGLAEEDDPGGHPRGQGERHLDDAVRSSRTTGGSEQIPPARRGLGISYRRARKQLQFGDEQAGLLEGREVAAPGWVSYQ